MKIIKYIFFLLLLVLIGGSVYVAINDGTYQIEESTVIDAPDELLFNTINEYKTWEKWGPFMDDSEDMILEYGFESSGDGASYSWKSETHENGSMKTIKTAPFTSINQERTFNTTMGESISDVYWKFEKVENKKTKVTWGMKGEQSFMEKAFWMTKDSTFSQNTRPMFKKGLEKLDAFVMQKMKEFSIHVDGITEHRESFYMYTATASSINDIPKKIQQMIPALQAYVKQNNLAQTGMPFTIFNELNEAQGTAIYSTGIPVREEVITPVDSNVLCGLLTKQKVVKTTLKGDYTNLQEAWTTAYQYITDHNLEINVASPTFEIYKTNPDLQPNPAEWVTELYIPIQ